MKPHWRGAWPRWGGAYVKRGLVDSSPAVIILNFTRGLPVYPDPDSRARAGRGVYRHRHHRHMGKGPTALKAVPATFDGTVRCALDEVYIPYYPSIPGVQ